MSDIKTRGWDSTQVRAFVLDAIRQHRAAWEVVPSVRRAIIAEAFASIVCGLDRETVPTVYLENLWHDMQARARAEGMP